MLVVAIPQSRRRGLENIPIRFHADYHTLVFFYDVACQYLTHRKTTVFYVSLNMTIVSFFQIESVPSCSMILRSKAYSEIY